MSAADEYARCTAALVARVDQPGAEGLYDQALTNGLAAIAQKRWPEELHISKGHVKSASQLLDVIERKAGGSLADCVELEDIEPTQA